MIDLSGKVFVVTGGNGDIGLGMAEGIAMAGGSVVLWGRNDVKNAEAVEAVERSGGRAAALVCDVADEEQVVEATRRSAELFGRLDGVFANAGRGGTGKPFLDTTLEEWRAVMAVNLDGVFLTLREAARHLVEQGEGGSLVAVSSTSAIHGAAGNEAYGTAKTALNGMVRALAVAPVTGSGSTPCSRAGRSPTWPGPVTSRWSSGRQPSSAHRSGAGPNRRSFVRSGPSWPTRARPTTPAKRSVSTAATRSFEVRSDLRGCPS